MKARVLKLGAASSAALLIVVFAVAGLAGAEEPPTIQYPEFVSEANFPMREVILSEPTGSPELTAHEAVAIGLRNLLGEELGAEFLSTDPAYRAELKDFRFNPDSANSPDSLLNQTFLVWVFRVDGIPYAVSCGPRAPKGWTKECPTTVNLIEIVDAQTGAILNGDIESLKPVLIPPRTEPSR
jgi:hypothetical protein